MSTHRFAVLLLAVLSTAGCGGGNGSGVGSDYESDASALCRELNEAAFAGPISFPRAAAIFGRFGNRLAGLSPPNELRRTHDLLLDFARGSVEVYGSVEDPPAPDVDPRLTVGDWDDEIPRVQRELPDCADSLTGTPPRPEIQVIR